MNGISIYKRRGAQGIVVLILAICIGSVLSASVAPEGAAPTPTSRYSANLLFNQANAAARQGRVGLAILDYERAQLLSPHDADISANLHFVRTKASLPDAPMNGLTRALSLFPPNVLAWLGCFGIVLVGINLLVRRARSRWPWIFRGLMTVGIVVVALAITNAVIVWPTLNRAVVIAPASARTSPVAAAETLFKLREGETVIVHGQRPDFSLVETSEGRSGWVARADLERVVPAPSSPRPAARPT